MTREEKDRIIEGLVERINRYNTMYLTDISDLNATHTSLLRRECFKKDIELVVVKNKLLEKALDRADDDYSELKSALKGHTSVMFTEVGNVPAKLIKEFKKKRNRPILKAASVSRALYVGEHYLDTLITIKTREELIGDIVLLLQSPIKRVVTSLQSGGHLLVGLLKTLSEKTEE